LAFLAFLTILVFDQNWSKFSQIWDEDNSEIILDSNLPTVLQFGGEFCKWAVFAK
jgi:hypothetical protein